MPLVGLAFTFKFWLQGDQMNNQLGALIRQVVYWSSKYFYTRAMSVTISQPRRVRGLICQGPWVSGWPYATLYSTPSTQSHKMQALEHFPGPKSAIDYLVCWSL